FLKKAGNGLYKKWSFRATMPEILEKYFVGSENGTHMIIPEIKNMARFSYTNLVENSYPEEMHNVDLILCHNVLIYFSEKEIKTTIGKFAARLAENGWLSVSSVEVPFVKDKHLQLHD